MPYSTFEQDMRMVWFMVAVAGLAHGSTIYTIVDLGRFSGQAPVSNSNASGAVVGGNGHAIVIDGATTTDLGVFPGGSWSAGYGINASGDVTGYGGTSGGHFRGFIWTPGGGMTMLGTLGGLDSYGMAINDSDMVAGHSSTSGGYMHAFVWAGGGLSDLGTLGGMSSYSYGINDTGAVVGYSVMSDGSMHAFLYVGGTMRDLNGLIGGGSGWMLNAAYGIDNKGEILGVGTYNGAEHEFRLEPVDTGGSGAGGSGVVLSAPEPSAFVLIGVGLMVLRWLRFRR
jgi:probable HAF family extracellular repeat protein